jgi:hypothetical protein
MIPVEFTPVSAEQVRSEGLDLIVAACGYEERAVFLPNYLGNRATRRVRLDFRELDDHPQRLLNEEVFRRLGYESLLCSGDDYHEAVKAVDDLSAIPDKRRLRIGIDISSMTRAWYWGLTKRLSIVSAKVPLEVFFFYTPARFSAPRVFAGPPKVFGPIPGLSNSLELPDREISLLIGLGYESDKALGLVEYIDARHTWLFYTDPAADARFTGAVKDANKFLFERVDPDNVISYRYDDLSHTLSGLDSLIRSLVRSSRVLIASLGPKPFGLIAYLLSLLHEEVDVWRVSGGASALPQKRIPLGQIMGVRVTFAERADALRAMF